MNLIPYRFEEPVHRFHNMVIDRMVGTDRIPVGDSEEQDGVSRSRGGQSVQEGATSSDMNPGECPWMGPGALLPDLGTAPT
jgi:hypothetical protein